MKTKIKKTLYLFSAILFALTSCSKEDNNLEQTPQIFVKRIVKIYNTNHPDGNTDTWNCKYNGNKIISATSDDGSFVASYTYTGDVITKIEERVSGNFQNSREYTYADGKVATCFFKFNNSYTPNYTYSYTYNSNGTISYKKNSTNRGVLTIVNGNIVKNEIFDSNGGSSYIYTFEFDTKNNPFKNVLGFNLLFDQDVDTFSRNNMTKDGSAGNSHFDYYTYKYDSNGFPIERKRDITNGGYDQLIQYFY